MLEAPPGVAWQACRRLVKRSGGGRTCLSCGGQSRAKSCFPSLEEVEDLEEASWATRIQKSQGSQYMDDETPASTYFKRPRIEDDYYVRPSRFGNEFLSDPPLTPGVVRDPIHREPHREPHRDPGFVNFRRMEEPVEVLAKLKDLSICLGTSQVEAAFSKLKLFNPPPSFALLDEVTRMSLGKIPDMNLWQVCCMFQSCARMNYKKVDLLDALSEVVLKHGTPLEVDPRHLSNLFYAIGLFHRRTAGTAKVRFDQHKQAWPSQGKLINTLIANMRSSTFIEELSEHDSVSLLYAFGQLLLPDVKDIVRSIYDHLNHPNHITQLTEVQIMTLLSSFVQIGVRNDELLKAVILELQKISSLSLFREEELSTIVYSLGVLKFADPGVPKVLSMVFEEVIKPMRLTELSERALVNLVYGLGQQRSLHGFERNAYFPRLFEEVRRESRLELYTNQGLCNLIYTMGILRYGKGLPMGALLPELAKRQRLADTSSQGITISLWGMAKVQHRDSKFLDTVAEEMMKPGRLSTFTCNGVSISMYSLGLMGYAQPRLVKTLLKEAMLPERMKGFGSQDRSNIAYAMGRWGKATVDWKIAAKLLKEFCLPKNLLNGAEQHLVNFLQCVVSLEISNPEIVRDLLDELSKPQRIMHYKPVEFAAILLAVSRLTPLGMQPRADVLWKNGLKPKRLELYTESALSGLGYGMGLYKFSSKPTLIDFMKEVTKPERLAGFNNTDLSNLVFSMTGCGIEDANLVGPLVQELCQPVRRSRLDTTHIVTSLSGITKMKDKISANACMRPILELLKDPDVQMKFDCNRMCVLFANLAFYEPVEPSDASYYELVKKMAEKLQVGAENLNIMHVSRMLLSVGQMKLPSHEFFHPVWECLMSEGNMEKIDDTHLSFIFANIARLSIPSRTKAEILPAIVQELERRGGLKKRPPSELLQMVQSMTRVGGAVVRPAVDACFQHLSHPENVDKLDSSQWGRIMDMSWG
ncbi:hypothetical protein BSKO_11691 [Bryopsis sp. KO-2023]|nr:hypothetical protein BSKO_11691 [Bryopsis sp. KO-2023]